MAEPYLIAHKVRGALAFDIAIQLPIGQETGWLIPTSGHRAYPFWQIPLSQLRINLHNEYKERFVSLTEALAYDGYSWNTVSNVPQVPPDLRDHYEQPLQLASKPMARTPHRSPPRTLDSLLSDL